VTAAPVLARTLRYKVTVSSGGTAGQSYVFEKPIVTVGRGPENDLVFSNDAKMSRTHIEIRLQLGHVIVRNISQKNILLVNGEKCEEKTLTDVSFLQVGETLLEIKMEVDKPKEQLQAPQPAVNKAVRLVGSQSEAKPQAYRPPPPPSHSAPTSQARQSSRASVSSQSGNSRVRFYSIVALVGGLFFWFVTSEKGPKKPEVQLRTEGDVVRAIEESAQAVQELKRQKETKGQDSLQYRAAQEHYIKGFRDYRQGQYARAIQSFQAARSFDPSHELAGKYLLQAQRKYEAQIDFNMSQGRKYYQKQNYKMCQSSFASVMIMVKDSSKPKYREAKQFYDECSLRTEGRF